MALVWRHPQIHAKKATSVLEVKTLQLLLITLAVQGTSVWREVQTKQVVPLGITNRIGREVIVKCVHLGSFVKLLVSASSYK